MILNVFRSKVKVGSLDILANEPFYGFTYDSEYLASPSALPLSLSLPLAQSRYCGIEAQPYFEGLLPEGEARDAIARRLGISRRSPTKLIRALGRECAGDISILDETEDPPPGLNQSQEKDQNIYLPLEGGIQRIAENPHEELPRLQENMRLSLAGGQGKIALYHDDTKHITQGWYIPLNGLPSTHIIKPGLLEAHYTHLTLNEFLCLRAASECGIHAVDVDLLCPEMPVIIVRRYDRIISDGVINGLKAVHRVHQEDCCQACGVKSDLKYEHDGGPGFKQVRGLLVKHARLPFKDIETLIKWGMYNYLIGNCDAHSKNLSLLHNMDGSVSLAPAYDLISTTIYDGCFGSKLSRNMGMRIGFHENIDKVNAEDFNIFARDVHVRLQQVVSLGKELIRRIPLAFNSAVLAAESAGFSAARDVAGRIMCGCEQRVRALTGS